MNTSSSEPVLFIPPTKMTLIETRDDVLSGLLAEAKNPATDAYRLREICTLVAPDNKAVLRALLRNPSLPPAGTMALLDPARPHAKGAEFLLLAIESGRFDDIADVVTGHPGAPMVSPALRLSLDAFLRKSANPDDIAKGHRAKAALASRPRLPQNIYGYLALSHNIEVAVALVRNPVAYDLLQVRAVLEDHLISIDENGFRVWSELDVEVSRNILTSETVLRENAAADDWRVRKAVWSNTELTDDLREMLDMEFGPLPADEKEMAHVR